MSPLLDSVMNGSTYIDDIINMKDEVVERSEVTEFYNGKNVLITGASGFIGKLLIEKLLRSCPDIGKIFALMRPKKGKTPTERLKEIFDDPLYDRLNKEQPDFSKHVTIIEGDTGLKNLGLTSTVREFLKENTHIVIHGAATVRFDESLRKVMHINVRGVKLMLELAKEMTNLKAFVHVSTAYSHCTLKLIEEKYYEPPMNVEKALALVEILDDDLLKHITPQVINKWPNTYAFSKALGEEIVRIYGSGLPTCIVRPSIVLSTSKEPVSGWIDNMYGATGVAAGAFLCILRTMHVDGCMRAEVIPADYVVNNIIVAAWDTGKRNELESMTRMTSHTEPPIYNSVTSSQNPLNWNSYMEWNYEHGVEVPSVRVFWSYLFILTKRKWFYNILAFFLHVIPAAMIDLLAVLTGRKAMLLKTYQKIHKFSDVIAYFSNQEWTFDNRNVQELWERTSNADREKFDFNVESLNWREYFVYHLRGIRVYLIKDPMSTLEKGRKRYNRLIAAHWTIMTLFGLFLAWVALRLIT